MQRSVVASALLLALAACAPNSSAPVPVEREHRKVAALFGWYDILPVSITPDPDKDPNYAVVLDPATLVECRPECRVIKKAKMVVDPRRIQQITVYRDNDRLRLIYRISDPILNHYYLVISPTRFGEI